MKRILVCMLCLSLFSHGWGTPLAQGCVIPLPAPEPEEPEHEVWHSFEGTSADGRWSYVVGIEVELFESTQSATCTCGVGFGNSALLAPASLTVSQASISIVDRLSHEVRGEEGEFEFENETEVENELEDDFDAGSHIFGFGADVASIASEPLEPEDAHTIYFQVQFAPEDFDAVNGIPIRFAAGSDMENHPLMVLNGYQTLLQLTRPGSPLDCNGDGIVNLSDANCAAAAQLSATLAAAQLPVGDADGDGTVQFSDFVILANNFGGAGNYTQGDFDKDGTIQFADFVILANNFGQVFAATAAVPEPTSRLLLLGAALPLLLGRRRGLAQRRVW